MTPERLAEVMEATWPPAAVRDLGPFRLRDGAGGGKRVSAASAEAAWDTASLRAALAVMADPLFLIREGDAVLDKALAAEGFAVVDPVVAYAAPAAALQGELPFLTAFPHWPPLEAARSIWAEGGIGPARVAVMQRTTGPKTALLARAEDRPAAAAFVACLGPDAMLHALEVRPLLRRRGVGRHLLTAAANWAVAQGAETLSLVVTERNLAARALYESLGMVVVGRYHYRAAPASAPAPVPAPAEGPRPA
ncbi:GNAT family N-acetyltransferase [Rhodobacter sp. Har01]|uniref:GNAT family N-acetyltransferase n=1 Tax=Rhodobacter sp. Har01 TaxID=2883999 RepID=UPI001D07CEA6|nr:GNAT family N-acetyltransferase [Rhodobacter sp. Har01]MCB6179523.1 GNAT family N-acetyltransferase [Rhodobacter sp. Har01]